jgi:hypothetical protein
MAWVIVLAIAALSALLAIVLRAGLTGARASVRQSWARLDELLIQRNDLLPELVEHCARHFRYEQEVLERVSNAGAAVFKAAARENIPALGAADKSFRDAVAALDAFAENYPQLGTDPAYAGLRERIRQIDAAIIDCRESYNSAVNLLNVRAQAFPHRLVAHAVGVRPAALLE